MYHLPSDHFYCFSSAEVNGTEKNYRSGVLTQMLTMFVFTSDPTHRILSVRLNAIFASKTFRVICNRHAKSSLLNQAGSNTVLSQSVDILLTSVLNKPKTQLPCSDKCKLKIVQLTFLRSMCLSFAFIIIVKSRLMG